jgi:fructose-bisphosphate aldolase, class I
MNTGKLVRLNRIFSHPSGRLCSVAVDHYIGYFSGMPEGLQNMRPTLAAIVAGSPDAVTMQKGVAASVWGEFAGKVPLIIQNTIGRPDDSAYEHLATPEDVIRLGGDAVATAAFVYGETEGKYLRAVSDLVRDAARFELPVIGHFYPRNPETGAVLFEPEAVAWAVRCAYEVGVDVIKVPYCGDVTAYGQIVSQTPVPVVAAGGPRAGTLAEALDMMTEVVRSGARGATIGRNVWSFPEITKAVLAFKAVIHDGKSAAEAMAAAGLSVM